VKIFTHPLLLVESGKLNLKNMKIQRFERIIAGQRAEYLAVSIYTEFSGNKDFRFKDQIQQSEKTFYF
jgi:hypothetical protein